MLVTLIGKKSINRIVLPQEVSGSYWLYDKDYDKNKKLINIESINNNWEIHSTSNCKIINNSNIILHDDYIDIVQNENIIIDKVILKNYSFYYVTIGQTNEPYIIYCSPIYEDNYAHLHIKNTFALYVGRDPSNSHILYDNPFISKTHAKISFFNGVWSIENYDKKFNTFVNDKPIFDSIKILSNGDRIFIYGLNIIILNKEIFINNPLNKVHWHDNYFTLDTNSNAQLINQEDDEFSNKYINNNYFLRTPRMQDLIEETEFSISAPQIAKKNRELPAALVLGSSLAMATITIISLVQTIDNYNSGKSTFKSMIFSLCISLVMLMSAVLIPILNKHFSSKIKTLNEKDAVENYKKYITGKKKAIDELLDRNRSILYTTYISPEECMEVILNNSPRLWEREITDNDFLTIRLGTGDIPSNLKLSYSIDEANIDETSDAYKAMIDCVESAKILTNAPILLSLTEKNIAAILYNDDELKNRYIQSLLLQLVTFQSYDELKLVFLLKDNTNNTWDYVKMLPHVWSNSKNIRFFADETSKINEISQYLEDEFKKRVKEFEQNSSYNYTRTLPYYLIIIDDYKTIEDLEIIREILKRQENLGFSILFLTDSILKLPNECSTFINIQDNKGTLFTSKNFTDSKLDFKISTSEIFFFEKITPILSNILIKYNEEKEMSLPNSYTFLEMYDAGCIEQLNILEKWRKSDSTISLSAPIGIDGTGKTISLDLHEKFHGPHGIIAGSTGSGKSEFIITYILSLAINYHPDDVTFVLIDYKGGGLAGAFKRPDVQLPHLVGTITNIDKSSLQRSLESIKSELQRRQFEFSEARIVTGESTIDIYKYQKYYHSGVLKKPISHLFIISDEFAELKQQEPDFMDELISVARIGRSLGVHLILATQKPAGVVNDQIRSNSKFGVCLKVQSPSDSKDIIDIPDAAKLAGAGQFYLKVGNDDYLVLGQSAWAGALYYPSNEVKKDYDNSIEFISSTGRILKKVDDIQKNSSENKGEQLTNIVKFISDLATKEKIQETPLWLEPIPETIYLADVRKKYKVPVKDNIINPVIGEYDDPSRQLQNVMQLNLSSGGNTIIFGNAESGKETLLSTMIYDIITNYSAEIANIYILDFGSETLKIFKKAPHVGDVILSSESEKVARFFMMLQKELKDRKEILSNYNGDYNYYIKSTGNIMPNYIIILNNYESFIENYPNNYDDILEVLLREGLKYGFVFVFTVSSSTSLRYRLSQSFKQKIALQMNKDDDYTSIFDRLGKKRPTPLFGRGLVNPEEKKYFEFQTAKICEPEDWNEKIMEVIEQQNKIATIQAKEIATVPELVTINHLESYLTDLSAFPVGISHKNITPCLLNLTENLINLILTNNIEEHSKFISSIIEEIKMLPNINFEVLDAENIIKSSQESLMDSYVGFFKNLNNSKKIKESVCIIIGIEKFINALGSEELFYESMKNAKALAKFHYIIIETPNKLNNYAYSEWFKNFAVNDTGLWLGNGVSEQYLLKSISSSFKLLNECGSSYGYAFTKGKPSLIKLLGMKETGEENE